VHNLINAWQHLNSIYKEALQRNVVHLFLDVLATLIDVSENAQVQLSPVLLTTPHQEAVGERVRLVDVANRQTESLSEHVQTATQSRDGSVKRPGCGLAFVATMTKITRAIILPQELLMNRLLHQSEILID